MFGKFLGPELCHDDSVADFGGNDGYAANEFYMAHKIKPLVIDCEPKRLEHADKVYRLPTYQSFIESMKELRSASIDWGFSSHTLEHTRDTAKALREMARVIKRGCYFVLPLERLSHARRNHAHAICFTRPRDWKRLMEANGWCVVKMRRVHEHELHAYGAPTHG